MNLVTCPICSFPVMAFVGPGGKIVLEEARERGATRRIILGVPAPHIRVTLRVTSDNPPILEAELAEPDVLRNSAGGI